MPDVSGERQNKLTSAMERAPPKSFLDAFQALLKWIEGVELLIQSESFSVNSVDVMEDQLTHYRVRKKHIKIFFHSNPYVEAMLVWISLRWKDYIHNKLRFLSKELRAAVPHNSYQ